MDKNEEATEVEDTLDIPEVTEGDVDTTDWKGEAQKLRDKAIQQRERTKLLKQQKAEAEAKLAELAGSTKSPTNQAPGELDETALDYLDLKGISDTDDIKVVQDVVKKTGMTVRQALKDDYVLNKLAANKQAREIADATPSNNRRGGQSGSNDLAVALAEYKASGLTKLPDDFALRTQVINAMQAEANPNKPGWR
jgi:hypothetical protein